MARVEPALRPCVLVLASGRGDRFRASGGDVHKLAALLHGHPVLAHVLDTVRAAGLPWHVEQGGHAGMGDTIAAAVAATRSAAGWLVLPADLPWVQPATLRTVAQALERHTVAVPRWRGERGHPVGFGRPCRDALLALHGDRGAAPVVAHWAGLGAVGWIDTVDEGCVRDVDTVQDLAVLAARMQAAADGCG